MRMLHPDVNVSDENGRTLLIITIQKGNNRIIRELLATDNIDVNKVDYGVMRLCTMLF